MLTVDSSQCINKRGLMEVFFQQSTHCTHSSSHFSIQKRRSFVAVKQKNMGNPGMTREFGLLNHDLWDDDLLSTA